MLFNAGQGELPTSAQVATAAGLAKGTVYIYFKTKEEIFANLLLEGWMPVMDAAQQIFQSPKGKQRAKVQGFITDLARHLVEHPEVLRLDLLSAGVLEQNMSPEALRDYKEKFHRHFLDTGACIDRALHLEEGRGVVLLMRTYALTRGLWQTTQHKQSLATEKNAATRKANAARFSEELVEALTEYWRGALASGAASARQDWSCV